jgi:hypothetical protein
MSAELLDGMLSREKIKSELQWSDSKLDRMVDAGLPVIRLGRTELYPIDLGRQWLLTRVNEPRATSKRTPEGEAHRLAAWRRKRREKEAAAELLNPPAERVSA